MQIHIAFPCTIAQIDHRTVMIEAKPINRPIVSEEVIELIAPALSMAEKDRLADDIAMFAQSEAIKRSLVVYPAPPRAEKTEEQF